MAERRCIDGQMPIRSCALLAKGLSACAMFSRSSQVIYLWRLWAEKRKEQSVVRINNSQTKGRLMSAEVEEYC